MKVTLDGADGWNYGWVTKGQGTSLGPSRVEEGLCYELSVSNMLVETFWVED